VSHSADGVLGGSLFGVIGGGFSFGGYLIATQDALLARDMREDIAVVVHLDNPTVGRAVEDATGAGSALDVAGLFAPAVVDACMGRTAYEVMLGEERFLAAEVEVDTPGTLRTLFGDLAPVGIITVEDELVVCPGRDHPVQVGDHVTVLGKPEDVERAGVPGMREPQQEAQSVGRSVRRMLRRFSRTLAEEADRAAVEGPAAVRQQRPGRVVEAVGGAGQPERAGLITPFEVGFGADRAQFVADPGIDRRRGQRTAGCAERRFGYGANRGNRGADRRNRKHPGGR